MKLISFFSYKGGAGRSSIAYNVIPFLADKLNATPEHPIILVDMDIDSAGLTYLVRRETEDNILKKKYYSVQSFLESGHGYPGSIVDSEDCPNIKDHPLFSQLNPVGNEFGLGSGEYNDRKILLMEVDPGSNFRSYNCNDIATNPIRNLSLKCKEYGCKALIFDTPAGDQQTARWSIEYSEDIVCCMRVTYQFREGTKEYLRRKDDDSDCSDKRFIIVPNAVPQESIRINNIDYNPDFIRNDILESMPEDMLSNNEMELSMLRDGFVGVPEVKRFKFQEGILYKDSEHQEDEKKALESYERLADIILRNTDES